MEATTNSPIRNFSPIHLQHTVRTAHRPKPDHLVGGYTESSAVVPYVLSMVAYTMVLIRAQQDGFINPEGFSVNSNDRYLIPLYAWILIYLPTLPDALVLLNRAW
jgi:hypothetical protein